MIGFREGESVRIALVFAYLSAFPLFAVSPEAINGTWEAFGVHFAPWTFTFRVEGKKLTGTVSQEEFDPPTGVGTDLTQAVEIYNGTINGDTISFKYDSPDGHEQRTITFTGKVDGDKILFTRTVKVWRGGDRGRNGIYGAKGATHFTATREASRK